MENHNWCDQKSSLKISKIYIWEGKYKDVIREWVPLFPFGVTLFQLIHTYQDLHGDIVA